jgi:eukaryotic-like serine/threonine-protein kinase
VLAVSQHILGDEHPDTLFAMNNLALSLSAHGDLARTRALQEQALADRRPRTHAP